MPVLGGSDEQDAGNKGVFLTCNCVKFCSQENIGRKSCIIMKKDRVAAFTDAVLVIIMTILVLELKKPELGSMWVNIHNEWESIEKINAKTL